MTSENNHESFGLFHYYYNISLWISIKISNVYIIPIDSYNEIIISYQDI